MVTTSPLIAAFYLLAAAPGNKGRQRYAPKRQRGGARGTASNNKRRQRSQMTKQVDVLPSPPPPTSTNGPFPTYFTCRLCFEDTLMQELLLFVDSLQVSSPYPGLVRVENNEDNESPPRDPVYALQVLPNCRIIRVENSIKGLAKSIATIPEFEIVLQDNPTKGCLVAHALVPGMCKGQREPKLQRRAYLVVDALLEMWRQRFPAARKANQQQQPLLLLQVMLLSPDVAAASLSTCNPLETFPSVTWPNPNFPLGMASVDVIDEKMPSSAYRKLLEAFSSWQRLPSNDHVVVDLGASPGGWTKALLLHCQPKRIIAVDRAELDVTLMKQHDDKSTTIEFCKGDAFCFLPKKKVDWMISDIIAYPERIIDLLETWCSNQLASCMVVTLKFQGELPSWNALDQAINVARNHKYHARAKHFFNNKNEVTLMLQHYSVDANDSQGMTTMIRGPIYERAWPKEQ